MNDKPYCLITGIIFALVAIVHLLRIAYDWSVHIENWIAPMWISWLGVVVAGLLALWAFSMAFKKE